MRRFTVLAAAVAAIGASMGSAATAASPKAVTPTWRVFPFEALPGGQDGYFQGVYGASTYAVFAAGYRIANVGGATEFRTLIERFNGGSWHSVNSQDTEGAPATNLLFGVSGTGPDDVWAVGFYRLRGQPDHTLVERWNGSGFTIVPTPDSTGFGDSLGAVSAAASNDVWAVGTGYMTGVEYGGITIHWDGTAWSNVPFPLLPGCVRRTELFGVAASEPSKAWAVGGCVTDAGERAVLARWNGRQWVAAKVELPPISHLDGVTVAGRSDVWAVGTQTVADPGGQQRTVPLVMHHTGRQWVFVDTGDIGAGAVPRAVSGSSHRLLIAGSKDNSQSSFAAPLTASFDGSVWRGESPDDDGYLTGVARIGNVGWAVGSALGKPYILFRSPN